MHRVEQAVVQFEEAVRLAEQATVPYLRLSLVLLDGLAELLMYRRCERHLQLGEMMRRIQDQHDQIVEQMVAEGPPDAAEARESRPLEGIVSKRRAKKVRQNFDAKAEFLSEKGELDDDQVRVLRRVRVPGRGVGA